MADTTDPMSGFFDALGKWSTFGGTTAGNMAKGLIEQARLQQEQDRLGLQRTNAGVNVGHLGVAQRHQALDAPGQLAGQSVQGDVLANGQDASFSGLPSYVTKPTTTGGLRPSLLSDSSRALGSTMSRNALADATSGKYTDLPSLPSVPNATPLPEASRLQDLLAKTGIAAGAGSAAGGILDALKKLLSGKGGGVSAPGGAPSQPGGYRRPGSQPGQPTSGNTGQHTGDFPDNLNNPTNPTGSTNTDEWMGQWPEQGGPGDSPVDPSQFGGGSNPMDEYQQWLDQQGGGSGGGGYYDDETGRYVAY